MFLDTLKLCNRYFEAEAVRQTGAVTNILYQIPNCNSKSGIPDLFGPTAGGFSLYLLGISPTDFASFSQQFSSFPHQNCFIYPKKCCLSPTVCCISPINCFISPTVWCISPCNFVSFCQKKTTKYFQFFPIFGAKFCLKCFKWAP